MSSLLNVDNLLYGEPEHTGAKPPNDPVINDSISSLINQWRNEIHSPEILSYKNDLMDEVMTSLTAQIVRLNYFLFSTLEYYFIPMFCNL